MKKLIFGLDSVDFVEGRGTSIDGAISDVSTLSAQVLQLVSMKSVTAHKAKEIFFIVIDKRINKRNI
jgi:hypothetical protein